MDGAIYILVFANVPARCSSDHRSSALVDRAVQDSRASLLVLSKIRFPQKKSTTVSTKSNDANDATVVRNDATMHRC